MAHIPDGIIALPVLVGGLGVTALGVGIALKVTDNRCIPRIAMLSALFFVASLIQLPAGVSTIHPLLGGLMGLVLGWAAFPAVVIALALQAVLFGFGGLTSLPVNAMNIAVPALLCHFALTPLLRNAPARFAPWIGGLAGALAIALTAAMVALTLAASGKEFIPAAKILAATYIPLMVVEAFLTAAAIGLLHKVKPEILSGGLTHLARGRA